MTQMVVTLDFFGLLGLVILHLAAGIAVGVWFRFGALLPLFLLIAIESIIGDARFGVAPWYVLLVAGLVVVQIGYALSSRFSLLRQTAGAARSMRVSTPE